MLAHFIIPLILFFLSSCQHFTKSEINVLEKIIKSERNTILANCEFFNLEGVAIRKYAGDLCVPFENGDLILMEYTTLTKLNKFNQVIWSNPEFAHHQMKKSFFNDDVVYISSFYTEDHGLRLRHDTVKVIDKNGVVKKDFDFSKFFSAQEKKEKMYKNFWHMSWLNKPFFEYTHINSIYEIIDTDANGTKQLNGYVINDRGTRKVFIIDADLKKVLSVYDFNFEAMHDVSFLNKNTLIYYANSNRLKTTKSYIATFNLSNRQHNILYGDSGSDFYSLNNGGVQQINNDLFLITHSPEESGSYVEVVNSQGQVLKKFTLKGHRRLVQDSKLGNYNEFLKNNIGY